MMNAEEVEKSIKEIWNLFKETDKRFRETDKEIDRVAKEVERVSNSVDRLTGKWGLFVEGMLIPAVRVLFQARGILVEKVFQRIKVHKNGDRMEIDILAVNQDSALLIEAKSTLGIEDVNEHLNRLKEFKKFFPEYQDKKAVGAVAGIVIEEGADKYAYRQGLFVIGQTGEMVRILNDEKFKPKFW